MDIVRVDAVAYSGGVVDVVGEDEMKPSSSCRHVLQVQSCGEDG